MSKPVPKKGPRSMSAPTKSSAPRSQGRPGPRPAADTRPPRPGSRTRTAPDGASDTRPARPGARTRTAPGGPSDTRSPRPEGRTRPTSDTAAEYRTPRPAGRTRTAPDTGADTRTPRPAGRTRTAPDAGSDYRTPRPAGRTRTAPDAGSDTRTPRPAGRTRTAPDAGSDTRAPRPAGRTRTAPGAAADTRSHRPDKRTRTAAPEAAKPRTLRPPTERRPARAGDERLQKILAAAGIDSRRACEEIILEGRVQINGVTVTELGTKADPRRDEITVDLIPIQREAPVYILMNKPKGYVTTVKDDQGRPTVMALLKDVAGRVYPVGRLDFNSEGLLLMTNDGALAQILMGPEHEVPKVYLVKVHRTPKPELLREFQEGFLLSGQRLKPCHIEIAEKGDNPWLKVTLTEGKNQQIRRMFAAVGHPVSKLRRVQFGPLADPLLKPGTWRYLSPQEITAIKSL